MTYTDLIAHVGHDVVVEAVEAKNGRSSYACVRCKQCNIELTKATNFYEVSTTPRVFKPYPKSATQGGKAKK